MNLINIILINSETKERKVVKSDANVLANISDYFNCMFNGNFTETSQKEIELQYDDLKTAEQFLEFINSDEEKIIFKTDYPENGIDLFKLLDLTQYWLMCDYVYEWCADEIAVNWYKYDLQTMFDYMEKYKFNRLVLDFEKCGINPIDLITAANSTSFRDTIKERCIWELQRNERFTLVDELNFYTQYIRLNPDEPKKYNTDDQSESISDTYIEEIRDIFEQLKNQEIKYSQLSIRWKNSSIKNELILAPNLRDLDLKVLKYFEPDPNREYEYRSDYSTDEQYADDVKHHKKVCLAIMDKIFENDTNKSEITKYLMAQISNNNYFHLINYKFVAKLYQHVTKEISSDFVHRFITKRKPDIFLLLPYINKSISDNI